MKKIIAKKTYNTETAEALKNKSFGQYGDPAGYEETLYKTKKGLFFIYGVGGASSKYPVENIVAITEAEANEF